MCICLLWYRYPCIGRCLDAWGHWLFRVISWSLSGGDEDQFLGNLLLQFIGLCTYHGRPCQIHLNQLARFLICPSLWWRRISFYVTWGNHRATVSLMIEGWDAIFLQFAVSVILSWWPLTRNWITFQLARYRFMVRAWPNVDCIFQSHWCCLAHWCYDVSCWRVSGSFRSLSWYLCCSCG